MAKMNQAMSDLLRYNAAILPRKRSSFNKSHSHTTTFDSGYIIPLMWDRVLPGDEKKIKYSGLARMTTPIHPVMDEANLDVWAFYVPDRLWWNHAKEFYGENKDASFNPDGEYVMPYLKPSQYSVDGNEKYNVNNKYGVGGLNDYFGFTNKTGADYHDNTPELWCTAGLHRSYQLIWNEWFRNSSIQPALQLNDGDTVTSEELDVIMTMRKANKYPDYFTTLLREPQAGEDVYLPLGEWAPVVTRSDLSVSSSRDALKIGLVGGSTSLVDDGGYPLYFSPVSGTSAEVTVDSDTFGNGTYLHHERSIYPRNLWTDLTSATQVTINNIRAAVTVQHLLEIDNLAGKRYQQIIQAHFGVFTPDATLQRPELLGATRTSIGMRQVVQTSNVEGNAPLGTTAAYSLTNVNNEWICNKAFTEPGFILVLGCVRPVISYSQGIDPLLTKIERYDHYWPVFDNLGNQPVYNYNIKFSGDLLGTSPDEYDHYTDVFGYQEAWTEYRVKQNRVSGLMRPDVQGTLASWNYSMNFVTAPKLDSAFIEVDPDFIDRTLAVQDEPQFICDSYFDYIDIKNMSVHSIPGLNRL